MPSVSPRSLAPMLGAAVGLLAAALQPAVAPPPAFAAAGSVFNSGASMTLNASDGGSTITVLFVPDPGGGDYTFTDTGGLQVGGGGCTPVSAIQVTCIAQAATDIAITVNAGAGAGDGPDTVNVNRVGSGDSVAVNAGAGDDTIVVPAPPSAGAVVSVNGGAGANDVVRYDDDAFATPQTYVVTSASFGRTDTTSYGHTTYDASVERLELLTSGGNDQIDINSLLAGDTLSVIPGGGIDTVIVATSSANLDNIPGAIEVAGDGADVMSIYDYASPDASAFEISANSIDRETFGGLTFSGSFAALVLNSTFNFGSTYDITGSPAGTPFTIYASNQSDTFNAGPSLASFAGTLTLFGGGGVDALNIDDSGSGGGRTYGITGSSISATGSAGLTLDPNNAIESFTLTTTSHNDTVNLDSFLAPLIVNAGAGDDVVNMGSATHLGAFSHAPHVNGGDGFDVLMPDDRNATAGQVYEVAPSSAGRAALNQRATHEQVEQVSLIQGSGNDTTSVSGTAPGVRNTLLAQAGNDAFTVGPNLGAIAGRLIIAGSIGTDTIAISDAASVTSYIYDVRGGESVERWGLLPITYNTIEQDTFTGGAQPDNINFISTASGGNTSVLTGNGDDYVLVFAEGIAATGAASLQGQGGASDVLQLFAAGSGATLNGSFIATPGAHNVAYSGFEWQFTYAELDSDGDGCSDVEEFGQDVFFGGRRSPGNPWDFYDVTGDQRVDLSDTLEVLGAFGLNQGDIGYMPHLDRDAPDPQRFWATMQDKSGTGIDLTDALVNLASFGHDCTAPP